MSTSSFSQLHDEKTFYKAFFKDLEQCKEELIIESPYITSMRMKYINPLFQKLLNKKVRIYVITKNLEDLDTTLRDQFIVEIQILERIGVTPLLCIGNHHRKLAIIDRKILWEGSLNILSQTKSREIMRRIENEELTLEMFHFLRFSKYIDSP